MTVARGTFVIVRTGIPGSLRADFESLCRKMRCDGERPICGSCREREIDCVYNEEDRRKQVLSETHIEPY